MENDTLSCDARKAKGYSQEKVFRQKWGWGALIWGRSKGREQNISIQNLILIAITLETEICNLIPPIDVLKHPKEKPNTMIINTFF